MPGDRYVIRDETKGWGNPGAVELIDLHTGKPVASWDFNNWHARFDARNKARNRARVLNEAWNNQPIPGYRKDAG